MTPTAAGTLAALSLLLATAATAQLGDTRMAQAPPAPGTPAPTNTAPKGDSLALKDVPYCGPAWEAKLDGPQDFMFPSAMRSVMQFLGEDKSRDYRFYLAVTGQAFQQLWDPAKWDCAFDDFWLISNEPGHAGKRAFQAAGYSYRVIGNEPVLKARGRELPCDQVVAPEELKRLVCESIRAGKPVIASPLRSAAGVIAGYEQGGDVVVGWAMADDMPNLQHDANGYIRFPDWLADTEAVILIGDKGTPLSPEEACKQALTWAVEAARTPQTGTHYSGLTAFTAWATSLQDDAACQAPQADLQPRLMNHFFLSLMLAEGRAFAPELLHKAAELKPAAAEDLNAASDCYHLIHDLMWRVWGTGGGMAPDDNVLRRLPDPEVRKELLRIITLVCAKDAEAVTHIQQALVHFGVPATRLPKASEYETSVLAAAQIRKDTSGGATSAPGRQVVDLWVEGVPQLGFMRKKDCTFAGALEAALAPTTTPYTYADIMGYTGLAFRTRWFRNPDREATPFGNGRWHPISPHGEGPEELAAFAQLSGWKLRRETLEAADPILQRERLLTDAVIAINEGLPLLVGLNTDMACAYGYNIHSMNLLVRDYQRPESADVRVPGHGDPALQSPFIFLDGIGEGQPLQEAFIASLEAAVKASQRQPADHFVYGPAALSAWSEDLAAFDGLSPEEQGLLALSNWWTLMHLADARSAAVDFLQDGRDLVEGDVRDALDIALDPLREEVALLTGFMDDHTNCLPWWGGAAGIQDWDAGMRKTQQDLLVQARTLEEQAFHLLSGVVEMQKAAEAQ